MIKIKINQEEILFFGNPNGSFKSKNRIISKFNRIAKIAKNYDSIYLKLISILKGKNDKKSHCAYACLLMFDTGIRIGNESSSEGYISKVKEFEGQIVQTYGLTTLKIEHIKFENNKMYLDFIGKKVVEQLIEINDDLLIEYGKKFYDEQKETWLNITNYELTKFVKKYIGKKFVPKDLRTIKANIEAFKYSKYILETKETPKKKSEIKKEIKEICEIVSEKLGNSPQICKKAYVDSKLFEFHINERYKKDDKRIN